MKVNANFTQNCTVTSVGQVEGKCAVHLDGKLFSLTILLDADHPVAKVLGQHGAPVAIAFEVGEAPRVDDGLSMGDEIVVPVPAKAVPKLRVQADTSNPELERLIANGAVATPEFPVLGLNKVKEHLGLVDYPVDPNQPHVGTLTRTGGPQ